MDRATVMAWVSAYERGWRDADLAAVEALFTEDAVYRRSPYEADEVGHDAIKAFWIDDELTFSARAEPVAVEADRAVVRLEVHYGDPVTDSFRDLWVLRFAHDGRVAEFEEWPFFPGQPFATPPC